jgi:hypothetical protein
MKLAEEWFSSIFEQKILRSYRKLFSIDEISQSAALQWIFGASLLVFLRTFFDWTSSHAFTLDTVARGMHVCWPYFRECGELSFLLALPEGYSQSALYMVFFGVMLLVVYFMYKKEWLLAHAALMVLFIWKVLAIFVFTRSLAANYEYYHLILTGILLLLPYKDFFLRIVFVLLYFLASTIKFHEGWILGTYFTSLQAGLPVFPDAIAPVIAGIVIFMQVIGAWFLLSKHPKLRIATLSYFVLFHLYSGILVEYRYPVAVLPPLLILFGLFPKTLRPPRGWNALPGVLLIAALVSLQLFSMSTPRDQKMTLERNYFGLYMFEANHQCVTRITVVYPDGTAGEPTVYERAMARDRCDPYADWFRIKARCALSPGEAKVSWQFDHSVNGGPFYRIVDSTDACALEYRTLGNNEWIRTPDEGAPVIGYPVKNIYSQ